MREQNIYIDVILQVSLQLREGDALSINSEDRNMEFAQKTAEKAVEITGIPVKIVSIEEGVVKDVFTVDPVHREMLAEDSQSKVLLYLAEPLDVMLLEEYAPASIAQSPPLLQSAGNLAPPQLDRPVAPFAVAPVPSQSWAAQIYQGHASPLGHFWKFISSFLFLEDQFMNSWAMQLRKLVAVIRRVQNEQGATVVIRDGERALSLPLLPSGEMRQPLQSLESGRIFLPRLSSRGISFLPDPAKVTGSLAATRTFRLLGAAVNDLSFSFSEGKVKTWESESGDKAVEASLRIDSGSSRIGLCTLVEEVEVDSYTPEDIPHEFMESVTTFITLGSGESSHLRNLELYADEEDLQERTGMNISFLKADIPIGSSRTEVDLITREGIHIELMRNGKFIIPSEAV